jgi:hypothetical protein
LGQLLEPALGFGVVAAEVLCVDGEAARWMVVAPIILKAGVELSEVVKLEGETANGNETNVVCSKSGRLPVALDLVSTSSLTPHMQFR